MTAFFDLGCKYGKYAMALGILQVAIYVGIRIGYRFPIF